MSEEQKKDKGQDAKKPETTITISGEEFDKKKLAKSLLYSLEAVIFRSDVEHSKDDLNAYWPAFHFAMALVIE